MKVYNNISAQQVSWIKSNKMKLEKESRIHNLYYPETLKEFKDLLIDLIANNKKIEIIGYSSNTLFLPSYHVENLICTKKLNKWFEKDNEIICECGVNVSILSRKMVEKGYVGFEGLTDLPGTIGAAVYGNCGCRGCSVNELVKSFCMLTPDGKITYHTIEDLKLSYRSTVLKRGELKGVILEVILNKRPGDKQSLKEIAEFNHRYRKMTQPSAVNNLGTTFISCRNATLKGKLYRVFIKIASPFIKDRVKSYSMFLKIIGKKQFVPYTYRLKRYMFLDEKSHVLFPQYVNFVKSLFIDAELEIEIRK